MTDHYLLGVVSLYGVTSLGVATLAIAIRRAKRRNRASREMLTRLWRWRDC